MAGFNKNEGTIILDNLIEAIAENKQYLSDIDGAIADGDHGINMNKGFSLSKAELEKNPGDIVHGLNTLSRMLMMKIGGSMGPLYGKFFKSFAQAWQDKEEIDAEAFAEGLNKARDSISSLSQAKPGDKTLFDALFPAVDTFNAALANGSKFALALEQMKKAAEKGKEDTRDMVAKFGRSARLGERSKGVVDAGAASCALILGVIADSVKKLIDE